MKKQLVAAVAAAGCAMASAPAAHAATYDVWRAWGDNRYDTAADVATLWEADPAAPDAPITDVLFVASGATFPDGLAAGAAAGGYGAPLLLAPRTGRLGATTIAQIKRLRPTSIVLVGGTGAVSETVATQLEGYVAPGEMIRVAGANRYATAANLSQDWTETGKTVYLASGESFADALTAGAAAGTIGEPLLLTQARVLPAETAAALKRLRPAKVVLAGGTGAVSSAVVTAIKAAVPGVTVQRAAGADRYQTAVAVSKTVNTTSDLAFVASGQTFVDALSASAAAGAFEAPLVLSQKTCAPTASTAEIARVGATDVFLVGGPGVLVDGVLAKPCA